jgi:hypothetical protein
MTDDERVGPLDEAGWERRQAACRAEIAQLDWLIGRWRGRGESTTGTRVSDVETQKLFDGTFLRSHERTYTATGELEQEDMTVFGSSPEKGEGELWAHIYMTGGLTTTYNVTIFADTVLCEPRGFGARLSFAREGDGYRVRVYFPGERGTWVEDSSLRYERTE